MNLNAIKGSNFKQYLLLLFFCSSLLTAAQNNHRNLSSENWTFRKSTESNWLPAKIPGTVHTDLLANKLIPDPFFGANEKQLQWIENEDWQYQTSFNISKEELSNQNCELQFDGLDTFAEVYLNGTQILSANNMFRTWKVEVKELLKIGQNKLEITFASSVKKGKEAADKLTYTLPGDEKIFTRKAQYQFGWDWGPRFVTAGIWKKIQLHFWNSPRIENVKYNQKMLTNTKAELEFLITIQSLIKGKFQIEINDKKENVQLQKGENAISISYSIQNPKRWWPNGLGEAHLYPFEISLSQNNTIIDSKKLNIGIRTIELVQEKDEIGKSFYFKVNGKPVFMKGANVIPPDSFLPRATDSVYKSIVKNAVDANMNMLRVWGGGVYAEDVFYDECDKNGILVWQDFMFACAMYPGDNDFLDSVKNEVIDNVTRLQNHPCIALWCGNNEIDEGWHNWGWQKEFNYSPEQEKSIWNDYKKLFQELIPQTLDTMLSTNENRYWSSSPSIGWGKKESLLQGDSHYWGVWWGMEPFEMYEKKVGRFMSEYGFQGMPDLETFKSFTNEEDLNMNSESVKNHQKHKTGYATIQTYMERDYKIPKSFEDYIYVSQLLQANGMKTAIESHRRAKPNCMGTLYWQLNDCWPVTSWSSVDYFGRWKALHYQVKQSFENVLISMQRDDDSYKMFVINDHLKELKGNLVLEVIDFRGKKLLEINEFVSIAANSSLGYYEFHKSDLRNISMEELIVTMSFKSTTTETKSNFYFVKPKDLKLLKPNIQIKKIDEVTLEVTSDVLAKNVFLSSGDAFFSDNYFDVLPNEKKMISITGKLLEKIEVKSLFDVE
jgi:beta-mannosidase